MRIDSLKRAARFAAAVASQLTGALLCLAGFGKVRVLSDTAEWIVQAVHIPMAAANFATAFAASLELVLGIGLFLDRAHRAKYAAVGVGIFASYAIVLATFGGAGCACFSVDDAAFLAFLNLHPIVRDVVLAAVCGFIGLAERGKRGGHRA
ncbi:MAG TPA: DoxX family membrane protein [Opitutaceae bacterium]|jgi:uncharacterized membrane protein YphA (DoxX/SURF4 family)